MPRILSQSQRALHHFSPISIATWISSLSPHLSESFLHGCRLQSRQYVRRTEASLNASVPPASTSPHPTITLPPHYTSYLPIANDDLAFSPYHLCGGNDSIYSTLKLLLGQIVCRKSWMTGFSFDLCDVSILSLKQGQKLNIQDKNPLINRALSSVLSYF